MSVTVSNCADFPGDFIDGQFDTRILNGKSSLLSVTLFGEDVATGLDKLRLDFVVSSRLESVLLVSKI